MFDPTDSAMESYNFRLPRKLKIDFLKKTRKYGRTTDVIREILQAFVDDRLVIQPDPKKETLYDTRTQN